MLILLLFSGNASSVGHALLALLFALPITKPFIVMRVLFSWGWRGGWRWVELETLWDCQSSVHI